MIGSSAKRIAVATVAAVSVFSSLTGIDSASAATHKRPTADSTIGSTSTSDTAQRVIWGCHGHANVPSSAYSFSQKGIIYDAFQDCTGEFGLQKVCVQLWYLDYFGDPHSISTMSCGTASVSPHYYRSRFLSCKEIGLGSVRYFSKDKGYAYPYGKAVSRGGQSGTKTLC